MPLASPSCREAIFLRLIFCLQIAIKIYNLDCYLLTNLLFFDHLESASVKASLIDIDWEWSCCITNLPTEW